MFTETDSSRFRRNLSIFVVLLAEPSQPGALEREQQPFLLTLRHFGGFFLLQCSWFGVTESVPLWMVPGP